MRLPLIGESDGEELCLPSVALDVVASNDGLPDAVPPGRRSRVVGRRKSWVPTKQQERYAVGRMMGKTEKAAAAAAGYECTRTQLSRLRKDENLRAYMSGCLEDAGLTADRFAQVLAEGVGATKVVRTRYKGHVVEKFEDRDLTTARSYLKMAMDLVGLDKGSLKPKEEAAGATYVLPNNLEGYTTDQIIEEMRKRKKAGG